jgi:hypothetical protein
MYSTVKQEKSDKEKAERPRKTPAKKAPVPVVEDPCLDVLGDDLLQLDGKDEFGDLLDFDPNENFTDLEVKPLPANSKTASSAKKVCLRF